MPMPVEMLNNFSNYVTGVGSIEGHRRCVQLISDRSPQIKDKCANIVLGGESLACVLAKLMIFDLAKHVPVENVYSVAKISKEEALKRIANRYKKKHAVILSSNVETGRLAKSVCDFGMDGMRGGL